MPSSHGQLLAKNWSGGVLVTMVTTRPMNHGTALSDSATNNSITNSAANSHFAWRAKCHRNAISPPGGSGFSGAAVGVRNRSKNANICGWLQGLCGKRQSMRQSLANPAPQAAEGWEGYRAALRHDGVL